MKEAIRRVKDVFSKNCDCKDCTAGRKFLPFFEWLQDNLCDARNACPSDLWKQYAEHMRIEAQQ
jgi:hypothetical protein